MNYNIYIYLYLSLNKNQTSFSNMTILNNVNLHLSKLANIYNSKHISRIPLTESAHIIVSTMVWVGLIKPLFPFGSRGCVSSLHFKLYSFGRELTSDFAGAATALILWGGKDEALLGQMFVRKGARLRLRMKAIKLYTVNVCVVCDVGQPHNDWLMLKVWFLKVAYDSAKTIINPNSFTNLCVSNQRMEDQRYDKIQAKMWCQHFS